MYTEKILDSENKYGTKKRKSQLKPLISVILDSETTANNEEDGINARRSLQQCFKEGFKGQF